MAKINLKEDKILSDGDTFTEPICNSCRHHLGGFKCRAFDEIPDIILDGHNLHTSILPEQENDIVYDPKI